MPNICLGNLLPSSVLAYNNIDLIPNGFINVQGTTARPRTRNNGSGVISETEIITLLPADRIYAEFWYGVSTRVTGTSLNDLSPGGSTGAAFGALGGGAGFGIGSALGCSLQGDSERAISQWVFHVCDAETRLNREYILTAADVISKTITLPDYVIGVLGVTKEPIVFVSPTIPLTASQIAEAKAFSSDEVQNRLGRRVAPDQLTDSDMRVLLGISELNELENLGNSQGSIRGWPTTTVGQIQATFQNYSFDDPENMFIGVVRDERKNHYRADNEYERNQGHCFLNGNTDDLTDKKIAFRDIPTASDSDGNQSATTNLVKAGDKVYISYVAAINPIFRHATQNITNFFLFPDQQVYQLPPLDLVKQWNFKKFKFKVRKNPQDRPVLADITNDLNIEKQVEVVQNNGMITDAEKERQIARLRTGILLEDIECQRIIESKLERANRNPIIKGCYFADSRGILKLDFNSGSQPELVLARGAIRDQAWFTAFLEEMIASSNLFDSNGQLASFTANSFFDDFLFDTSDHVNMVLYDNEKYGYERRFAKALSKCSAFNKDTDGTGVGIPNLDFVKNNSPGRNNYDLTSAKFSSIPMQGSASLFACNIFFTYDFGFCTKGTITADMLLRTPTFEASLTSKSRVYVEQFAAQFALRRDGGIWVGTKPFVDGNYAVTTDPKRDFGFIVYPDSNNNSINYRMFEDSVFDKEVQSLQYEVLSTGHTLPTIDETITQESIQFGGYDKILGDQPGYSKGTEITTEDALILLKKVLPTVIKKENLTITQSENGRINVAGVPNRRLRKITINYVPTSIEFLNDSTRFVSFLFPTSKTVVDNIAIPYQGKISTHPKKVCVNIRYIPDGGWFIDGDILQHMKIVSVEAEYLAEEDYIKYKIETNILSTCFDPLGNWLVFYEDKAGNVGDTSRDGYSYDGSHLLNIDEYTAVHMPGFAEDTKTEISCLYSPDYGTTWYDFKAVVRTAVGDEVSSPYVFVDYFTGKVHLFYVMNTMLMHKIVDTSLFDIRDAFLAYKRPNKIDENTAQLYGLYHFSSNGRGMREIESHVVIANSANDFLTNELNITSLIKKQDRTGYRIVFSGDLKDYTEGFTGSDYFAYKDASGTLKIMTPYNGKLYCRASGNDGIAWFDFIEDGMYIHKNSSLQELKGIANLGLVADINKDFAYITYYVEGMLFLRKFNAGVNQNVNNDIKEAFSPDSQVYKSVFVVGSLSPEVKTAIKNKDTAIIFPYKDTSVDLFGEAFSISETPSLGYMTANGNLRFFYKDSAGNFRAFSYTNTPTLDIGYDKQ